MSIPLLTTKLYLPRTHSERIQRPQLVEKLEGGLNKRMTLVSAPPGFGKTTLLAGWIAKKEGPAAWLSMDSRDNDPSRFLSYLIAALRTLGNFFSKEGFGELAMEALQASHVRQTEKVLTILINEIVDLVESIASTDLPLLLVLDDYHVITEQAIFEATEFLIQSLPPSLHLIISSRVDPDLSLARWRVQGEVSELRAADLRFSPTEISDFFLNLLGVQLSRDDIVALETRTEGWVIGLQVAALSMRERNDVSTFIEAFTGSNRYILDFLVEEVLEQLPEKAQDFLLKTSILDRLCGSLCDFLTESTHSQGLLEELDHDNVFLVRLGDQGVWYRYHQLFREFLRTQLGRKTPQMVAQLHHRASIWLEQNGYLPEAIEHALYADSAKRSTTLIEEAARETIERGEWGTLQSWLGALKEEHIRERPKLCLAQAWSLLYTRPQQETEQWLQIAEGHLPTFENQNNIPDNSVNHQESENRLSVGNGLEVRKLAGEILVLRATLASMLGDTQKTIELGSRSLEYLPEDDDFLRSVVILSVGFAHRYKGETTEAKNAFQQAVKLSRKAGNRYQTLDGLCNLANIQLLEGEYNGAKETITAASGIVSLPSGKLSPITCEVYLLDGVYYYEQNNLGQAEESISESIRMNADQRIIELQYGGHVWLSKVMRAKGDLSGAVEQMEIAEHLAIKANLWRFQAHTSAVWAELYTFLGDFESARRWVSHLAEDRADRPVMLPRMEEFEDITRAHVYLAMNMPDRIPDLLMPGLEKAKSSGRMDNVYRMTAYLSLAQAEMGNSESAQEKMKWLLPKVATRGYMRLFLDCGQKMADLINQMNSIGVAPVYTRQLLVAFSKDTLVRENQSPSVSLLSNREREVLILISVGYSNREIADELVITVGTVKRHISNIYRKLNVSSRTQALAAAQELNLLT